MTGACAVDEFALYYVNSICNSPTDMLMHGQEIQSESSCKSWIFRGGNSCLNSLFKKKLVFNHCLGYMVTWYAAIILVLLSIKPSFSRKEGNV